jgi:hypothetical protein
MKRAARKCRRQALKLTKNEHVQGTAVKENKEKYELTEDYVSDKVSRRAIWVIFIFKNIVSISPFAVNLDWVLKWKKTLFRRSFWRINGLGLKNIVVFSF